MVFVGIVDEKHGFVGAASEWFGGPVHAQSSSPVVLDADPRQVDAVQRPGAYPHPTDRCSFSWERIVGEVCCHCGGDAGRIPRHGAPAAHEELHVVVSLVAIPADAVRVVPWRLFP